MLAVGLEELAISTIHDPEKVKSGRQKLFTIQQKRGSNNQHSDEDSLI